MVGSARPQSLSVRRCIVVVTTLHVPLDAVTLVVDGLVSRVPGAVVALGLGIMYLLMTARLLDVHPW